MDIWEILGIEATTEVSDIKRAYAKKLKIYHPEEDPQGYQKLREAYDFALKYAKNNKVIESVIAEETEAVYETQDEYKSNKVLIEETYNTTEEDSFRIPPHINITEEIVHTSDNKEQLVEEFFEKAVILYNNFFDRLDEKKWQELLNDEIMWDFDCKQLINDGMIKFLMQNYFLPSSVWLLLNEAFQWDEQENYLSSNYPENFVKYLLRKASWQGFPRYSYFDKNMQIEYDKYIYYREEAFYALLNNNLEKEKEFIFLAYEMYKKDPDLLCMMGDYYLRLKKNRKVSEAFKKAIKINPQDSYTRFYQGEILYINKKFTEALKICNNLKASISNNMELRILLGKCYFGKKNWKAASRVFRDNLKIEHDNIESIRYLIEIANKYERILKKHPLRFNVKKDLKNIYRAVGQANKIGELKMTFKDIFTIIKNLGIFSIVALVLIAMVSLALESGIPATSGLIIFITMIISGQKRRRA